MTKREKLFLKAQWHPENISFQELEVLLQHNGFRRVKTNSGSHLKWRQLEKDIVYMAPRRNPMKSIKEPPGNIVSL